MSIEIREVIEDKDSWFNIKRLRIGTITIERPVKVLDARPNNINRKAFSNFYQRRGEEPVIFESSKVIDYTSIERILNSNDQAYINRLFRLVSYDVDKRINSMIFTLRFNPYRYRYPAGLKGIEGFFDYYHQYSDILFVPNISRYRYNKEKDRKEEIISLSEYLRFVDEVYGIFLSLKNKRPVFVPISLKLSMNEADEMIDHYIKKGYFYYWFDFEGRAVNEHTIALITHINRRLKESEVFNNTVSYFTNIKREIISNPRIKEAPASDILTVFIGANIIGCNREPPRRKEEGGDDYQLRLDREKMLEHKARRFVDKTYYYIKVSEDNELSPKMKELLKEKKHNIIYNSLLLDKELDRQTKHFLTKLEIKNMLMDKRMLKEYREGQLFQTLFATKQRPSSMKITDFL